MHPRAAPRSARSGRHASRGQCWPLPALHFAHYMGALGRCMENAVLLLDTGPDMAAAGMAAGMGRGVQGLARHFLLQRHIVISLHIGARVPHSQRRLSGNPRHCLFAYAACRRAKPGHRIQTSSPVQRRSARSAAPAAARHSARGGALRWHGAHARGTLASALIESSERENKKYMAKSGGSDAKSAPIW